MAVANPATRTVPAGLRRGIEVVPGGIDGGEDRDGVVGQSLTCWGEPHPPTDGFEQRGPNLASQCGDLLRHRGRGDVELLRDLAHRADLREAQQHLQPAYVHAARLSINSERCVHESHVDVNSRSGVH